MDLPEPSPATPTGRFDMESLIGYILLSGVLLSVGLITAGLIWHQAAYGNLNVRYVIKGTNLLHFLKSTISGLRNRSANPDLLVDLGIGTLMLTPFVRVLTSFFSFMVEERNWKYTIFTLIVLLVLTVNLFIR